MASDLEELAYRESVFSWLRSQQLVKNSFTRDDLSEFSFQGEKLRLVGTQTGIWRNAKFSDSAISILTAYSPDDNKRPYNDGVGHDGLLRYKWRGEDPNKADNIWLRRAMQRHLPLIWFRGIGYLPGTKTQVFWPEFPVWLVAEEPEMYQFAVAVEEGQQASSRDSTAEVIEINKKYNERIVKVRHHQPMFRSIVIHAYDKRCAVCRLPFIELLDAAHIKSDSDGGAAKITNGLSLCKIHHGAFDSSIIGISPDYVVHVRKSVLATTDGPTLQYAIKEMDGEKLRQLPSNKIEHPDKNLLAERFEAFKAAS